MWSVNIISLLLFCYACLSIGNGEVYFESRNFYNVLKWDPVNPAVPGEKVLYTVMYLQDDNQGYQIKTECQNISKLSCDLTAETPSLHDIHYRANVYVNDSSIGFTTSFKPLRDTVLGPPILSTSMSVTTLHIKVSLPLGPNGVSVADIITQSKKVVFKTSPTYTLYITNPQSAAQEVESTTGEFNISVRYNHAEYCGYVVYKPNWEPGHSGSEKASFCASMPDQRISQWPFVTVIVGTVTVGVLATIVIVSALCTYNYVNGGKKKNMPQTLVITPRTGEVLQNPDKNLFLSELEFCNQIEKTIYATIRMYSKEPSHASGGYSPQDLPCYVWQNNTDSSVSTGAHSSTPNTRDTSSQSSEIYSAVAVHVPPGETEDVQQAINKETSHSSLSSVGVKIRDEEGTTPELRLHGLLAGLDASTRNPDNQLVLDKVWNINGQLMLPSLACKLQGSAADKATLNPESKPLLSDLMCCQDEPSLASLQSFDSSELQDSGCEGSTANTPTHPYCNTHYLLSQQGVHNCHQTEPSSGTIFESSYKQNWMTERRHRTASTDTWTSPQMGEVEENDETAEALESPLKYLLGHWKVKIQE